MSNLPRDMAEEVLSKVPLTSLRKIRSTCKEWKTLSKRRSFAKKHLGQASVGAAAHKVIMMMDLRIYLMNINLNNKNVESLSSVKVNLFRVQMKSISLESSTAMAYCHSSLKTAH
nr:unnamed protein product [Brassica rapa]